jgi:hypothetical protein
VNLSLLVERPSVEVVVVAVDLVLFGGRERFDCPLCSQEQAFVVNAERLFYCFGCGAKGAIAEDAA